MFLFRFNLILYFVFFASISQGFELSGEKISVSEVLPLFNIHKKSVFVPLRLRGVNKEPLIVPNAVKLRDISSSIDVVGFKGDVVFKDLIIKSSVKKIKIKLNVVNENDAIDVVPRIVTSWYQSGLSTKKKKHAGELTYELLLSDDLSADFSDKWLKNPKGGWVYSPPKVDNSNTLNTEIAPGFHKRILLKFLFGASVAPGAYSAEVKLMSSEGGVVDTLTIPLKIVVYPNELSTEVDKKYQFMLYTAFKLNDQIERPGSYVNAMRLSGDPAERQSQFFSYLSDIRSHGFNGITVRDWDEENLPFTLSMSKKLGFSYVVLHSTTPINPQLKANKKSIVSKAVKRIYHAHNMPLYYYGYDEVGGNRKIRDQLRLNQKVHNIGGASVNAVFWDDMPDVLGAINNDESKCFDIVAHSMGSHGHTGMFSSLPYKPKNDVCSKKGTKYLAYWHPNVENPTINRLFMGFWLWASGFDGVIPHGYYFPSHIEKTLSRQDVKNGVSTITSPYDDWAFWLPGQPLRHHNSVYPSSDGPVGTLEWEGVLNGYTDLRYILTLEEKMKSSGVNEAFRIGATKLLDEIRKDVLRINTPYMSDEDSIGYLVKLELWKREISNLLLN